MADAARARARNSAKQRRHYHRKQELTKTTLPAKEEALRQQLGALFARNSSNSPNSVAVAKQQLLMLGADDLPSARRLSREDRLTGLHRLKLLRAALLEQKRAKEQQLQALHEQQHAIQRLLGNDRLLRRCELVRARSLDEITRLQHSWRFAPASLDNTHCGWQEMRVVENDTFRWSMQKLVKLRRPRVLAQKTWEICADPDRWAALFSADTDVRCRLVEQVDASNVLMLHQHRDRSERPQQTAWKKTLALVTCATTPAGARLVVVRGLPSDRVFAPTGGEAPDDDDDDDALPCDSVWTDIFCWMEIRGVDDSQEDALCTFAGTVPTLRSRSAEQLWLREAVALALNWEAAAAVSA